MPRDEVDERLAGDLELVSHCHQGIHILNQNILYICVTKNQIKKPKKIKIDMGTKAKDITTGWPD